MGEIAKEKIENFESFDIKASIVPEIKPSEDFSIEQANDVYDKVTENVYSVENSKEVGEGSLLDDESIYDEIYDCNEEDFQFESFNIENEELESLLKYFEEETWQNLDIDDKKVVLRAFENYLVKVLDLKHPPKLVFYYGAEGDCGAFNRGTNTIKINMNMIDIPKGAINTIAHESWHAYQYQCAEYPQTRKDVLYAINFADYIRPVLVEGKWVMFEEYENQLVEAEARAFGSVYMDKVGES